MDSVTACTMDCPDACSLVLSATAGGSLRLRGNPSHPFTAGFVCAKIKNHIKRLHSPNRLVHPMIRRDSRWQRISWEEALALCVEKIQAYRHEPASILHIPGEGAKGVLKHATKLFFAQLGASRTRGSLCDAAGFMAYVHDFGSRQNHALNDLLNASTIVNWGKDLARSSIHTAAMVRKARRQGAQVVTISPGGDGNASFSDLMIRLRPGSDRFLAVSLLRLLLDRAQITPELLAQTQKWGSFKGLLQGLRVQRLTQACDVAPEDLERLYQIYTRQRPVATLVGTGLQRYRYGGEAVRFINALCLLSGNIGRPGGGSHFHLHAMRHFNLEWIKPAEVRSRRSFRLPLTGQEILSANNPSLQMLWINGTNVVNQAPDSLQIKRAFAKVPFKVVVDAFETDTVRMADLFLPSTLMLEQEDLVGSFLHDYVHHVAAVLPPPGETRDDYWILYQLSRRMDPPLKMPEAEDALRRALETSDLNLSLNKLRQQHFVEVRRPAIVYQNLQFDHPDGKYQFPIMLHHEPPPPVGYPLRLLTLISHKAIHSQILPEQQQELPTLQIATDCRHGRGLASSTPVDLVSPRGRLQVILERIEGLHPEVALVRRGRWMSCQGGFNQLITAELTDIGTGAAFYQQYVRIEPIL